MKKIFFFISILIFACCVKIFAQPPDGPATAGMIFGAETNADGTLSADELFSFMSDKSASEVKVRGKVVEVCKAEGCWLKMETANGPLMIKMKDHSFFVLLSINGKTIIAAGTVTYKESSVEMLKHYAEDARQSKEEIAAIIAPRKEITMQATGVLIL